MLSIYLFLCFIHTTHAFLNPFTRSESTRLKERCGHSILLNNNYWLLKQTYQALQAIQKKQIISENLPWHRLANSIEQIYQACLIDDVRYSKERMYLHQTAIKAGALLAKKAKDISQPTLIKIE